ncbi:hypothetical protein [Capnocytophaga stomatis]|nr:hypothetical protein [Capnocytophaga stomatis]
MNKGAMNNKTLGRIKKYDDSSDCQAERSRSLIITRLRLRSA